MAVSLVAVQSCEEKPKFGFAYSFTAVGDAKGDVDVVFPGGEFKGLGDAAIDFHFTNDTTKLDDAMKILNLEDAYAFSNDEDIVKACDAINSWLDENIDVSSASGDYYVHVSGYVEETFTKIKAFFERTFTNRKEITPGIFGGPYKKRRDDNH